MILLAERLAIQLNYALDILNIFQGIPTAFLSNDPAFSMAAAKSCMVSWLPVATFYVYGGLPYLAIIFLFSLLSSDFQF
jgi:hypothetical protein